MDYNMLPRTSHFGRTGLIVFVLILSVQTELRSDVGPSPATPSSDNSISSSHTGRVNISTTVPPLTISPEVRITATVSSTTENDRSIPVSNTTMTTTSAIVGADPTTHISSSTKGPQHFQNGHTSTTQFMDKSSNPSVDFHTGQPVRTTSSVNATDISHTTLPVSATTNGTMATGQTANHFSTVTEHISLKDGTKNETTQSATTVAVMNTSMSPSQTLNSPSPTKHTFNTTVPTQSTLNTAGPTDQTFRATGPTDQTFNTTVSNGQSLNTTVPTQSIRTDETTMTNNSSITPNPLGNSSTNSPNHIPLPTRHQQPMPLQNNTEVPGWGIALLVLAALMLLILLIFLIFLIYFCCCQGGGRSFMTVSDPAPYMPFNPDIPMYSTHTTIDLPNGKTYETDDSTKNRSGMYVVNPSAK